MEPSLSQRYLHRHLAGPSVASRRCDPPGRRQLPNSRKPTGSHHTEEETMNRFEHDAEQYVRTVLNLYQQLPETPALPSSRDRFHAHQLQQRGLPLTLIETAFLLGSLRRLLRPPEASVLSPLHSLPYFEPVIGVLLHHPLPDTSIEYLRHKIQLYPGKKIKEQKTHPENFRKNTDSE